MGLGKVEVHSIDFLKLVGPGGRKCEHGVILKIVATPKGMVLGHEISGEVIECERCRNCKERHTDVCLNVNTTRAGGAYGYVDLGGWIDGQAEYVMVPYADWNLLKFPDKAQALENIRDLTCLTDILPTGYHGCVTAGVTTGSTVLVVDVWEHAFLLDYKPSERAKYLEACFSNIDWTKVEHRLKPGTTLE